MTLEEMRRKSIRGPVNADELDAAISEALAVHAPGVSLNDDVTKALAVEVVDYINGDGRYSEYDDRGNFKGN